MSISIKSLNIFVFFSVLTLVFSGCCRVPLVDCGPKITHVRLLNDSIVLNKNKIIKIELWEYQERGKNYKSYNANFNAIIGMHDSLDFSVAKVSLINSKDSIFSASPLIIKNTVLGSNKNVIYSFEFKNATYENYHFIILNDIKMFNREEYKWDNYSSKVEILN